MCVFPSLSKTSSGVKANVVSLIVDEVVVLRGQAEVDVLEDVAGRLTNGNVHQRPGT